MKRLAATVVSVIAIVLVCASAAGASPSRRPVDLLHLQRNVVSLPGGPLAQADAQTYPVSGTLEDFDGTPLANCSISCGWWDPDGYSWYAPHVRYHDAGDTTTAADGSFSFAGLASHPAHDTVMAQGNASSSLEILTLYHLDFSTTGTYAIRPGHVNVSVTNAPAGQPADMSVGDALYSDIESSVALTDGSGVADTIAPDFDSASASFPNANGTVTAECQWVSPGHAPVAVSPGTVAGTPLSLDWHSAVRGHLAGPQCRHSGRPGSTVRYAISNLPAGQQISFTGNSWSSSFSSDQIFPQVLTSTGLQKTRTVALHIPANAPVGNVYEINAQRSDDTQSLLWLYDWYEVCTFSASHSTIVQGQAVRLHGHIDCNRQATLFMCHHWADRPATVGAHGWIKIANLHVNASGRFVSPLLHPSRTRWYVVRYPGLNGGFVAFTPVVKVTVR
jgi:hypothetical protein